MSESTLKNYARPLAKMAIYFGCDPTNLDFEQVQDYLLYLKETTKSGNRIAMQKCNYLQQNCRLLKGCSIKKIILQVKLAAKTHKI